jgi:hypothetical protein
MSEHSRQLRDGLVRPRQASYGDPLARRTAVGFVGGVTGVAAAMAMYAFRLQELAPAWASETLLGVTVLVGGVLVKLLVGQMRASVSALLVSLAVGSAAMLAFEVVPFYLLDIGTAGGLALFVPLRDVITFLLFFQIPLQFLGFLLAVVVEAFRA